MRALVSLPCGAGAGKRTLEGVEPPELVARDEVSDNGGAPKLLAWKESGGFGGTYSPNAAFGQTEFLMSGGHTYTFSLRWKTNHAATGPGATIFAGAGPISGSFSPTSLDVELVA